jgi:hypothetical protein
MIFVMALSDMETNVRLAEIEHNYWTSPEWFLKDLNTCEVTAKTDADGKFSINLPAIK